MGSPVQPQTQNGWSYVRNNPANRVDPSGKVDWGACTINGATGVCFAEPGDYLYKIAREIAAEISMTPDEQLVNALMGEILHLNPQLQARPNLIYPGEEIKLQAEWIMAMRPSQPTPVPTPPPPPPPPPPTHLPTVLKGGCPSSSEVTFEPLRIELRYPGTSAIPIELILFPPDMPPIIEANRDENRARLLGTLSLAADWVELSTIPLSFTPFGALPDWVALGDIVIAGFGSYYVGETYLLERPHPSLPPMVVLGQDILVTSADAGLATLSKVILPILGMEIGAAASGVGGIAGGIVGYITGQAVDVGTTLHSIGYDRGRLEGTKPIYLSYGIFWEDRLRQAILIYGQK